MVFEFSPNLHFHKISDSFFIRLVSTFTFHVFGRLKIFAFKLLQIEKHIITMHNVQREDDFKKIIFIE